MATELVLLSEIPVSQAAMQRALLRVEGKGRLLELRSGEYTSLMGAEDQHLLTIHAPKVIHVPEEAGQALAMPPEHFSLWTEMTVPFGVFAAGRVLAEEIATEVRGKIAERV